MTASCLKDLTKKFGINFTEEYYPFENSILSIFNSSDIDNLEFDHQNHLLLNIAGLFYKNVALDDQKAISLWEESKKFGNVDAILNIGTVYYCKKEYDQALVYINQAKELGNKFSDYFLGNYNFIEKKDYAKAKEHYLQVIEAVQLPVAYNELGVLYWDGEKNYEEAKKYFEIAAEYENLDGFNNLGVYYKEIIKDYDKALEYFRIVKEKDYKCADYFIGDTLLLKKEYQEGLSILELGYEIDKDDRYLTSIATYYKSTVMDYEKALKYYFLLEEIKGPDNLDISDNIGYCYYNLKQYENSIKYYQKGADKNDITSLYSIGVYYFDIAHDEQKALEYFLKCQAINQKDTSTLIMLSRVYYNCQDTTNMNLILDIGAELNNYDICLKGGDYYYKIIKNYKEAAKYYLLCYQINPEQDIPIIDLAFSYQAIGEYALSYSYFTIIIKERYKDSYSIYYKEIFYVLSNMLYVNGKYTLLQEAKLTENECVALAQEYLHFTLSNHFASHYEIGIHYTFQKKYHLAIDFMSKEPIDSSNYGISMLNAAKICKIHLQNNDMALEFYEKGAAAGDIPCLEYLGNWYLEHKETYKSLSYFQEAIQKGSLFSLSTKGIILLKLLQNKEEGEKCIIESYEKSKELAASSTNKTIKATCILNYYRFLCESNRLDEAFHLLTTSIEEFENAELLNELGLHNKNILNNKLKTKDLFLQAIQIDPNLDIVYFNLATLYEELNELSLATENYEMGASKGNIACITHLAEYYHLEFIKMFPFLEYSEILTNYFYTKSLSYYKLSIEKSPDCYNNYKKLASLYKIVTKYDLMLENYYLCIETQEREKKITKSFDDSIFQSIKDDLSLPLIEFKNTNFFVLFMCLTMISNPSQESENLKLFLLSKFEEAFSDHKKYISVMTRLKEPVFDMCVVCLEGDIPLVPFPCVHQLCCSCYLKVQKCPYCQRSKLMN